MSNQLRFQRTCLYMLKRDYGLPLDIYKLVDSQTDARTGKRIISVRVHHVRRALVMPLTTRRKGLLRKMSAGMEAIRDFQASGAFDVGAGTFVIDRADVPAYLELSADDWLVYEGKKFPVETVKEFEMGGWIITVGELVGEVPAQVFDIKGESNINVAGEA